MSGSSGAAAETASRIAAELDDPGATRWFRAPGRVNLIGEHTDYNDGFVLPLAIDRGCTLAAAPAPAVRVRSLDVEGTVEVPADGSADPAAVDPGWGRYVAGVVRELAVRGRPSVGMDGVVASDLPIGSGLSSSAALEVACAIGLAEVAGWHPDPVELAQACRNAEEAAVGVPCGIMDQLASIAGRAGSALLIDCRSLAVTRVPLPDRLAVLAVHSGIPRTLDASAYAERRQACEELAARLGLAALRDATLELVAGEPLGRHVVTENERVLAAVDALTNGDFDTLGRLLRESHASLREDFGVSTQELDVLVEELVAAGAFGARLTGAGFGGCVVAACDADSVDTVATAAAAGYRQQTGLEPTAFVCRADHGARRVDGPVSSSQRRGA